MIRNTSSVGTYSPVTGTDIHGDKIKTAGLCFDLYDDDAGLYNTLDALDQYGYKATFFLGGEFIRRHGQSAKMIIDRGHETASLFFSGIDLSDSRYRVSVDFIKQGLARNEDDFFKAAGRELALIWHPPFYASSGFIRSAAASAGYITVDRSFDTMDWVSRDEEVRLGLTILSPSELIDIIISKTQNSSIIPVRLGIIPGSRKEYLYDRINVLLDALAKEGITVAPVTSLK